MHRGGVGDGCLDARVESAVPTPQQNRRQTAQECQCLGLTPLLYGKHKITSGAPSGAAEGAYNAESESKNWYFAVGGYSAWGKGNATVCKDEYTLEFEYKFYDRYNWDTGKSVEILGKTVTDQFMGDFHRQGLAKEFDMRGSVKKTVKWKKGQAAKVTEGWDSERGR